MKFKSSGLLPLHTQSLPKLIKIGPVVFEQIMLRTTEDDGRQPKAIGHLNDSGDLIKACNYFLDFYAYTNKSIELF